MKILLNNAKNKYTKVNLGDKVEDIAIERNGRPLTLILCALLIICCSSWTITVYFAAKAPTDKCTEIPNDLRFDCHPDGNANQHTCLKRGCCWAAPKGEQSINLNIPFCFYPNGYSLYRKTQSFLSDKEEIHEFVQIKKSGFPEDVSNVQLEISCFDKKILRLKIRDKDSSRYEVPYTNFENKSRNLHECDLQVLMDDSTMNFQIIRQKTRQVIFDTYNAGTFIFANQFLQISSVLPSNYVYGLGEHRKSFLKNTNQWQQFSFWNADQWPSAKSTNLYGSHPFYINMNPETKSGYGFLWLNSNAMEVVLQPTPGITLRSLGGIFDLFFIAGPDPSSIVSQYTKIVGKSYLPPYWSLGYHQCKFGYGSLNRTRQVLEQTQKAGIPIDVQWNDIDYMDNHKDFTYDKNGQFKDLPSFVQGLHEQGLHYVPIIDPGISSTEKAYYKAYDYGLKMDIFIKNASSVPFNGRVWTDGKTVWPDFTHESTEKYWYTMFKDYHDQVAFDGAWIDMNEPSNFYDGQEHGCEDSQWNNPPYVPRSIDGGKLFHKTLCPSAKQALGRHYDLHNLYGYSEAITTNKVLTDIRQKRPFIISRSTFPGFGHYAGHWTGDVLSDWSSLHDSITGVINFNLYGIPLVGADICGFNGNTTAKLCQRWTELGAFYPFSRNHNTDNGIDQDPVSLGPAVVQAAKESLERRYELLPYLYTLFVKAHLFGHPVVTPTFFHAHPGDKQAYYIDNQMFWGNELLICPVLNEDKFVVTAYLPSGIWYDYRSYSRISAQVPGFVTLPAPPEIVPLLAKGGSIFPSQLPGAKTTKDSQSMPFHIKVFLSENQHASGELFWDDGDSLSTYHRKAYSHVLFHAGNSRLKAIMKRNSSLLPLPRIQNVSVIGLNLNVTQVELGQKSIPFDYDAKLNVLKIQLNLTMPQNFILKWK